MTPPALWCAAQAGLEWHLRNNWQSAPVLQDTQLVVPVASGEGPDGGSLRLMRDGTRCTRFP